MRDKNNRKVVRGDWIAYEFDGSKYFSVRVEEIEYDDENYEPSDLVKINHFHKGKFTDIYRYSERIIKLPSDEKERNATMMLLTLEL